ncbi:hypothetical protein D3C87_284720 [compost metagenome]
MQQMPVISSKLSIPSWFQLIIGMGAMLSIEFMIVMTYPVVGIPILLLSCWWLVKQPLRVHFYEEKVVVSYLRRKRIIPYTEIEYLRFSIPPKSDPVLSMKILGEKKRVPFEYGNNKEKLALIFNVFRSRSIRIKDEGAKSRIFVELVDGSYQVKRKS